MMTSGQERAVRELGCIQAASQGNLELLNTPELVNNRVVVAISVRMGPVETREGGLELHEREEFLLSVPPDFPFEFPTIFITDERFSRVSHVIWSKWICLYQSSLEWNPADGMYGFFDRFCKWLGKAAVNDLDPLEDPLEPPHHVTSFSQVPFVIRSNAPVAAGTPWYGVAELERHPNRIELVEWNDLMGDWPRARQLALAIILPKPLPMQFPKMGAELFRELDKQNVDRNQIVRNLALASLLTEKGDPVHLVVGLPMRRAADGSPRIHVAVWSTPPEFSETLRKVLPENADSDAIRAIRQDLSDALSSVFEKTEIVWCRIMEDRPEIVVRRDRGTSLEWFAGKKVLVVGCGALGSWVAEMLTRVGLKSLRLLDTAIVKPGVLARQNYLPSDIGARKSDALAGRLKAVDPKIDVVGIAAEAHAYLTGTPDVALGYDAIIDCTASNTFQMKMERDWRLFGGRMPPVVSMITDSKAKRCLLVCLGPGSTGGIWDAYVHLKYSLCTQADSADLISAFYSEAAAKNLFQPEPGCSDPTFSGSTADVCCIASTALNIAAQHLASSHSPMGTALSAHSFERTGETKTFRLVGMQETVAGGYRVRVAENVHREARAWVRRNNRIRSRSYETGGLLWGHWDDAVNVLWIFDASGPPPDSRHEPEHFVCGVEGTLIEHERRMAQSRGTCGFVGFWHTHPAMSSHQSIVDIGGMAELVSRIGQNQRRSAMLIFGRTAGGAAAATIHVYESHSLARSGDLIAVGVGDIALETPVV